MTLTRDELIRYNRQIILPDFGVEGQEKLRYASVLIIGAGGLGAPNLQYLTAAGIGRIGVIDFDEVSLSNLQRQVLFTTREVGQNKALTAIEKLQKLNPDTQFDCFETQIDASNAMELIGDYDLVIDGSDNLPTRYLVNDACVLLEKPLIYGAIFRFEGQVYSIRNWMGGREGPITVIFSLHHHRQRWCPAVAREAYLAYCRAS